MDCVWKPLALALLIPVLGGLTTYGEEAAKDQPAEIKSSPLTEQQARERAKLMHQVYATTLDVMHERYFDNERAIVPARAMEDVFAEMNRQTKIQARWISVNTKPMSLNHEPKSDFEKQAAAAIAKGKEEFELVEKGYYQRAAAIPLVSGCVGCHTGHFSGEPKSPRFAALIIGMPIDE